MVADLQDLLSSLEYEDRIFRMYWREGPIPMAIASGDLGDFGKFVAANSRFLHMLGYERDELLDKSFGEVTHSHDLADDMEHAMGVRMGRRDPRCGHDKRYVHKSGQVVPVKLFVTTMDDTYGEFKYFLKAALPMSPGDGVCPYLPSHMKCPWRDDVRPS